MQNLKPKIKKKEKDSPFLNKIFNFKFLIINSEQERGYIALISVLIVLSLVVLIASSANLASISESDMGLKEQQSWETFYLATACAEHALMSLKEDLNYSGSETLTFTNGECTIENIEGTGNQDRVVKVSGSAYDFTRRIKVEINTVTPETDVESWEEVVDF